MGTEYFRVHGRRVAGEGRRSRGPAKRDAHRLIGAHSAMLSAPDQLTRALERIEQPPEGALARELSMSAEVIFQRATYSGMPVVVEALEVLRQVLEERGEWEV